MSMLAIHKSEQAVYDRAVRMSDAELASAVRDVLGAKLTAYIGGVKSTRSVTQWIDEGVAIRGVNARERLILALRVASMICERDSKRVAQVWFQGMNPILDDEAPARVIATSDPADEDAGRVLSAARQFAALG